MPFREGMLRRLPNLANPSPLSNPRGDLAGAMAGTLASVPQTMAYGLIIGAALGGEWSGIGVMAALFGSVMAGLGAVLLGGCPIVITGPRAATILVLVGFYGQLRAIPGLAAAGDPGFLALTLGGVAVAMAGLLQLGFGALRLGRLGSYIPVPVVAGFVNSSAILILLSQVWPATGLPAQVPLRDIASHLGEIRPLTLLLALGTAAVILKGGRLVKGVPPSLAGIALGTLAYHAADMAGLGQALGGTMPPLLDHVTFDFVGGPALGLLAGPSGGSLVPLVLTTAATIAVLSSLDTLLTVSACDAQTLGRSDGSRQLAAEGAANLVAGLFGLPPSSGSMARTSAALRGGMTTALGPLLVAAFTAVVALVLAPFIQYLPKAAMAGLLIAVAVELFDKWTIATVRRLLREPEKRLAARGDLLAVSLVVLTSVTVNLATAVIVGVLVSLVSFVVQMARSPIRRSYRATTLIPRIHGDEARLGFITRHGSRIAVIEMEGALFYGTAAPLETAVDALIADGVVHIVCDIKRVKDIDVTGARVLERVQAKLTRLGGILAIGYVERERRSRDQGRGDERRRAPWQARQIWRKLDFLGSVKVLGEDRLLPDTNQALLLCERHLAARIADEDSQPDTLWGQAAILRSIDRGGVRRLRGFMTMEEYQPGEMIFAQGDPPDSVYFIAGGVVEVVIDLPGTERKMRLQTLSRGAVFGEMAIIAPCPRSASVTATAPTRCYRLEAGMFERLKHEQPDLAFGLLSNMADIFAQRLRATNMMLADMEV